MKHVLLILLFTTALLLVSCGGTPNESNGVDTGMNFSADNAVKYTIIRSDTAEDYESRQRLNCVNPLSGLPVKK